MATSLEILTGSAADGSGRVVPAHQPLGESGHAAFSRLRRDDDDVAFARLGSIMEVPFRPLEVFRRQDFPHLTLRSPARLCGCPASHSVCVCVFQAVTQHVLWCDICNHACGCGGVCGQKMFRISCLQWKDHLQF